MVVAEYTVVATAADLTPAELENAIEAETNALMREWDAWRKYGYDNSYSDGFKWRRGKQCPDHEEQWKVVRCAKRALKNVIEGLNVDKGMTHQQLVQVAMLCRKHGER